jgi:hypothetical protein
VCARITPAQIAEISGSHARGESGFALAHHTGMSFLRTMSLIAGGAILALGGSALALLV